ncbi:GntR family transcriptional regulator, partial [Clostridium botulinum]|nr:GntR family transcriptional regulator [Clostridium botulinum]
MIKVYPRSSSPIYEQVELSIKELILRGALN